MGCFAGVLLLFHFYAPRGQCICAKGSTIYIGNGTVSVHGAGEGRQGAGDGDPPGTKRSVASECDTVATAEVAVELTESPSHSEVKEATAPYPLAEAGRFRAPRRYSQVGSDVV
jgi:hypothetical protein